MRSVSKIHLRPRIEKEKEVYSNRLISHNLAESEAACSSADVQFSNESDVENIIITILLSKNNVQQKKTLKEKIGDWYFKNMPSQECFEELLHILVEENLDVPLSANSFVGKWERLSLTNIFPGFYCHFGVKKQLSRISSIINGCHGIVIDINIDGQRLFKSSRIQLWPILAKIVNFPNISIFPIGVYIGKNKPGSIASFLGDMVAELKDLLEHGILIDNTVTAIKNRALICDAPAKAFACGIVDHTSSHGCTKCTQISKKIQNVLTYSSTSGELITDGDFATRKYLKHHQKEFHSKQSPFEELGLGMITEVPLDPMHLIDLGVMKKILVRMNTKRTSKSMPLPHIKRCTLALQPIPPYNMATSPCESWSNLKELFDERFKEMNNTIQKLQEIIVKQNDTIMKALAEQKVLTERVPNQEVTNNNVRTVFPIQHIGELNELSNTISKDNRELYINMMKSLLKGTLTEVISMSVCMDVNMDGVHGKKRLKDFKAFFQALTDACRSLGSNEVEKDIRNALKIIKKRHIHAECIKNKNNES